MYPHRSAGTSNSPCGSAEAACATGRGCGFCVEACPERAIRLQRRDRAA
ncbi:hypothetical protein FNZ56_02995 [Pseudoluteimonas lycopersici]|uniref:4Fe-4S ferredoxin-type domain-containing protein n=1 Tax=Pseudoluteimonas lycopersici TaxID=1324796 RepID=A0A516V8D9_9GAMM|nr:hypothetical protein FNZ56_02995 [Lysobacter lycopersici]